MIPCLLGSGCDSNWNNDSKEIWDRHFEGWRTQCKSDTDPSWKLFLDPINIGLKVRWGGIVNSIYTPITFHRLIGLIFYLLILNKNPIV